MRELTRAEFRSGSRLRTVPKGLLYGLQCMESWLFDDTKPFIHLECLDTLQFLREQIKTGYFEDLIQKYLLDNAHGAVGCGCAGEGT